MNARTKGVPGRRECAVNARENWKSETATDRLRIAEKVEDNTHKTYQRRRIRRMQKCDGMWDGDVFRLRRG